MKTEDLQRALNAKFLALIDDHREPPFIVVLNDQDADPRVLETLDTLKGVAAVIVNRFVPPGAAYVIDKAALNKALASELTLITSAES